MSRHVILTKTSLPHKWSCHRQQVCWEVSFQDFLWNKCDKFWRINFKHWLYASYKLHWICFPETYISNTMFVQDIKHKSIFIWLNAIKYTNINNRPNIVFWKTFNSLQRTPSQTQCTVWITFSTSFYINSDMNIQFLGNKTPAPGAIPTTALSISFVNKIDCFNCSILPWQ